MLIACNFIVVCLRGGISNLNATNLQTQTHRSNWWWTPVRSIHKMLTSNSHFSFGLFAIQYLLIILAAIWAAVNKQDSNWQVLFLQQRVCMSIVRSLTLTLLEFLQGHLNLKFLGNIPTPISNLQSWMTSPVLLLWFCIAILYVFGTLKLFTPMIDEQRRLYKINSTGNGLYCILYV